MKPKSKLRLFLPLALMLLLQACSSKSHSHNNSHIEEQHSPLIMKILNSDVYDTLNIDIKKISKTEKQWKEQLSSSEYRILRNKGTEVPFVNEYWDNKEEGIYYCRGCGLPLFKSAHKYKSGTGWPSFWQPINKKVVEERVDNSFFMTRTEIVCARCESHIGHVFDDGPEPTGLRYCMNSTALKFEKKKK